VLGVAGLIALGGLGHLGGYWFLERAQADWNEDLRAALAELGRPGIERARAARAAQEVAMAAAPKVVDGVKTYGEVCAACHQADGAGIPGAFPPLAASDWVAKEPRVLVRIVLGGLQGPISVNGTPYNSAMPGFAQLSDEEVAAVLTHVRTSFGNSAGPIDAAAVKAERGAGAANPRGWTAESVLAP
jgi:mono/diheme cytochrome c family protein